MTIQSRLHEVQEKIVSITTQIKRLNDELNELGGYLQPAPQIRVLAMEMANYIGYREALEEELEFLQEVVR